MEKECYTCDWFVTFDGAVNICCRHKIEIVPHENCWCLYWTPNLNQCEVKMNDDIHDNDTMDSSIEEDDQTVPRQE